MCPARPGLPSSYTALVLGFSVASLTAQVAGDSVTVPGWSMGGATALQLALDRAHTVESLIVVGA